MKKAHKNFVSQRTFGKEKIIFGLMIATEQDNSTQILIKHFNHIFYSVQAFNDWIDFISSVISSKWGYWSPSTYFTMCKNSWVKY